MNKRLMVIGLRANIGIMVDISRRLALTGYLGDIGYQHSWVKVNRMTVRDNEFRFDVVNNFGLGVVIKMYNEKRRTKNDNP